MNPGARPAEMAMMRRRVSSVGTWGWSQVAYSSRGKLYRTAALVLLAGALGVAGCGRRGPLEPPSPAVTTTSPQATTQQTAATGTAGQNQAPPKPDKPFILDPLLR
jgi:predicted small lipoprotein YifL